MREELGTCFLLYCSSILIGFEWKDIKQILLNGVRTSFAVDIDTVWIQSFEAEINRIFKEHNILF